MGWRSQGASATMPVTSHKRLVILKSMSKCSQINHIRVLSSLSIGQHIYRAFPSLYNVLLARAGLEHAVLAGLVGEHKCFAALVNRRVPWMLAQCATSWRERPPARPPACGLLPSSPSRLLRCSWPPPWPFLGSQGEAGLRMDLLACVNPFQGGGGRGVEVGVVWPPLRTACVALGVLPSPAPGTVPRVGPVCLGDLPEGLERSDRHVL